MNNRRAWAYDNFRRFLEELLRTRSLRQIAARAGVHHATLRRIVDGKNEPKLSTARAVIDAYVGVGWP